MKAVGHTIAGRDAFHRVPNFFTDDVEVVPTKATRAFTLLELMIVCGIVALIATTGVPIVYRMWHQQPLRDAVADTVAVCNFARKEAILNNKMVLLVIHPLERRLEAADTGGSSRDSEQTGVEIRSANSSKDGSSAQYADDIVIEDLDINKVPGGFTDQEVAYVRFFPNGTCDEMTLIIRYENQWRLIRLETSTSLADVESDPHKFR